MKFTRESVTPMTIRAVADGEVRIGDQVYRETVAVTATGIVEDWRPTPVADLTPDDLEPVLQQAPDVLVLGTGARNEFAPQQVLFALARRGIGLEVMDTKAAARTFNVLAGEGRNVAAVLYL